MRNANAIGPFVSIEPKVMRPRMILSLRVQSDPLRSFSRMSQPAKKMNAVSNISVRTSVARRGT